MPRRRYALERGGPKRLELRWKRGLKDFQVELDGHVWSVDRTAVLAGTSITLPGGSSLFVHWVKRRWSSIALRDTLRVDRDGVPLPGSDEDPRVVGRSAASVIALFGLLRFLLLGLWFSFRGDARPGSGIDPWLVVVGAEGAVLVALAVAAAMGARAAVIAAAALLALEFVAGLAISGGRPPGLGTVIQVLVIVHLYQSWQRMKSKVPTANLAAVFE